MYITDYPYIYLYLYNRLPFNCIENFQYASSWAPPSDGEDEMDLTRDIHPALRSQLAPPVTNSGRQYSQKPPPLPLVSVSKTTYDAAVSGARKTSTSHAVVNVRIDRSSKDLRKIWKYEIIYNRKL